MIDAATRDLLCLTLTPGLGPVLIERACQTLGGPADVLRAPASTLATVRGIGEDGARRIRAGLDQAPRLADEEIALAHSLGVRFVVRTAPDYPEMLRAIDGAPTILSIRGTLDPERDRHAVALVGSRRCTHYGVEQAERFAAALAGAGLTIVSGGARGIDTAAHRAALRVGGRTIVVLGCGLSQCYPPENADMYDEIIARGGAIVSELPLRTAPSPENFPARNRIISGLSLGVLVIEAGRGSGALITARLAAEDHGREVMAVPGRVDSPSSEGTHELLRDGGAGLVTSPAHVLEALEAPARHLHAGVFEHRYAPASRQDPDPALPIIDRPPAPPPAPVGLSDVQRSILEALAEPLQMDDLVRATGLPAEAVFADTTMLEVRGLLVRAGGVVRRADRRSDRLPRG